MCKENRTPFKPATASQCLKADFWKAEILKKKKRRRKKKKSGVGVGVGGGGGGEEVMG